MRSLPKHAFCINQNNKEKHYVDLVNILAIIDNGKYHDKLSFLFLPAGHFPFNN